MSGVTPLTGAMSNDGNGGGMDVFGWMNNTRNDIMGIGRQADLAQQAAMAEQAQRQAVTKEARATRDRLNLAAQSPQQLAALDRSLQAAQTQVDFDLKQLNAIDPAIMEASKQVLSLLKGEGAAINNPVMAQRLQQRQDLVNSLRSQYGPGAESTAIGQKALQQFDMQSNTLFQQNQMGALSNAFNVATARPTGHGFGQLMGVGQGYGDYQNRLLGAEQIGSAGILNAMGGEVQGAGAQFTGDLLRAGARRQFFTNMENDGRQIGRSWATMGMSNKGGGGAGGGQGMNAQDTSMPLIGSQREFNGGSRGYNGGGSTMME